MATFDNFYDFFKKEANSCQTTLIISDTHFNDKELKLGISKRPQDEELLKQINSKIGKNDFLIHLGDCGDLSYIKRLKGKTKWLITGNHDIGHTQYERKVYIKTFSVKDYSKKEALTAMEKLYPKCKYIIHEETSSNSPYDYWVVEADNMLFDKVFTGPVMIAEKLILSHEPIEGIEWAMNLHGHIHDTRHKNDKYHFNFCADTINYTPINFNQWIKEGYLSNINSIHRITINNATKRAKNRKR